MSNIGPEMEPVPIHPFYFYPVFLGILQDTAPFLRIPTYIKSVILLTTGSFDLEKFFAGVIRTRKFQVARYSISHEDFPPKELGRRQQRQHYTHRTVPYNSAARQENRYKRGERGSTSGVDRSSTRPVLSGCYCCGLNEFIKPKDRLPKRPPVIIAFQ